MEENQSTKTSEKENPALIAGSIILAGLLIAGAVLYTNKGSSPPKTAKKETAAAIPQPPTREEIERGGAVLGNPEAPVTIVEFSDFQCPYCEKFFQTTEKSLIEKYVKTGKVKFVYRHYAFLGPESLRAAEASECAKEQDKFWEYHNYLFEHQGEENSGAFSKENLKYFALVLKLDTDKFASCLDSDKYADVVSQDKIAGDRFGVTGTPTSFVNGEKLVGTIPFDQKEAEALRQPKGFDTVIQEHLNNKK